jgi:hypothetical protein
MPSTEYENRADSVLAWKRAQKLGRFDPNAPSIEQQKILASEREVEERGKIRLVVQVYDRGRPMLVIVKPLPKWSKKQMCSRRMQLWQPDLLQS